MWELNSKSVLRKKISCGGAFSAEKESGDEGVSPGKLKIPFSKHLPFVAEVFILCEAFPTTIKSTTSPLNMSATTTVTQAEPITAQSILRLFPDIDTSSAELDGHDEEQIRLMDEVCIVLDENDKPIGNFSKKICKYPFLSRSISSH